VENLTRKAQLQEVELERTTKQLKEAIAIASEETAKCKAAKEVIKSLTAQVETLSLEPLLTTILSQQLQALTYSQSKIRRTQKYSFSYWICTQIKDW